MRSATGPPQFSLGLGCEQVWNLKGGMLEWNDARLPIEH